jgi:putative phosphoribosyl transferase
VIGIPRTGALVAREVGERLELPHDFLVVRRDAEKTIAPDGVLCLSAGAEDGFAPMAQAADLAKDRDAVSRQQRSWRGELPALDVAGRQVVLVDLALQTGDHMCAAATWAWSNLAASVIVAVPLGARPMVRRVGGHVGVVVCLRSPAELPSVSAAFERLERVTPASVAEGA